MKDILADLETVSAEINRWPVATCLGPTYRKFANEKLVPPLQRRLALWNELDKTNSPLKAQFRFARIFDMSLLAHWDDAEATKALEDAAKSANAQEASGGKVGLLLRDWFKEISPEAQTKVVEQFRTLAKASPTDDLLAEGLLRASEYGCSSAELAEAARVIVETDLKGPVATRYKSTPNRIGRPLVITGNTVQGKSFTSADWKGKVVLVDFWATWCPPCREELPRIKKLYDDFHGQGLEIVGVSSDTNKQALAQFAKDNSMAWPQLFGPAPGGGWHVLTKRFGVDSIPRLYLIDRNGVLRSMTARGEAEKLIPKLLAEEYKPDATPAARKGSGRQQWRRGEARDPPGRRRPPPARRDPPANTDRDGSFECHICVEL